MKTSRNIGGSILPSSSPQILEPLICRFGTFQVRALPDADTHALLAITEGAEHELARHPNGYSCRALAERIASGDVQRATDQASYIIRCGGSADSARVRAIMEECP